MATNLSKLRVSFTKHGAHKIAFLLQEYDKDEVINHLKGDTKDINIDKAQTEAILSIDKNGIAPNIWNSIKEYGQEDIFDLVFVAIVFSHTDLISTMISAIENGCVIKRGDVIGGKAYSNFAHIIEQFKFSIEHTSDYISFDLSRIFYKFYLPKLIAKILEIKLTEAGWEKDTTLAEECLKHNFNKVLGIDEEVFNKWIENGTEVELKSIEKVKTKRNIPKGILFRNGHNTKFEGDINIVKSSRHRVTLKHNKIQNELYKILLERFPKYDIGTEVTTNAGTVDIVRVSDGDYIFYEIKSSENVKQNIREAFSQLMEYAYWNEIEKIDELYIVSPCESTEESRNYLKKLRKKFGIPIYYQCFNPDTKTLSDRE